MSVTQAYVNAQVLTPQGIVDSFSVKDGKIVSLNDSSGDKNRKVTDLNGKCVIPGFIDSHTHMLRLGLEIDGLSLEGIRSREEALEKVRRYSDKEKGDIIVGYGWDESLWESNDFLYSEDLKFTERKVVLFRRDEHMAVVNEPVLRSLSTSGHNVNSNGILKEEELGLLRNLTKPGTETARNALKAAIRNATSLGVTGLRDMVDSFTDRIYDSFRPDIMVKRVVYDYAYTSDYKKSRDRWGIKTFLDGSIGSLTAAHNGWNENNLKFNREDLDNHLNRFWKLNWPVAIHAIGEIATEVAVRALSNSPRTIMNSIEHFELTPDEVIDGIPENTVISAQPNFLSWAGKNGMYERNLGTNWLENNNVYRKILDGGIKMAFGSDCMPLDPINGISYAINSGYSSQKISLMEAISAYTEGSALLLGAGNFKGRIDKGFDADFLILTDNFLNEKHPKSNSIVETVISGHTVYSSDEVSV